MITFAQFKPNQLSIEIRHDAAFLLWDKAGTLGQYIKQLYSDVEIMESSPGKIVIDAESRYRITLAIDRMSVIDHVPPMQIDSDIEKTEKLFKFYTDRLEIKKLNRVGTRVIYSIKTETQNDAAQLVLDGSRFNFAEEKLFSVEPGPVRPGITFVSEDSSLGYRFSLSTQDREVSFNPPLNAPELKAQTAKTAYLQLDIDLYTAAPIDLQAFNLLGWLERARRAINRDSDKILKKI
jgi:hypothetical protein